MKKLLWVGMFCVILLGSSAVYAFGTGPDKNPEESLLKQLNLSSQQMDQLKALHEEQLKQSRTTFKQIRQYHEQLTNELKKDKPDYQKAQGLIASIKTASAQLEEIRLSNIIKMRSILTAAEFRQLTQRMDERRKDMMKHFKKDMGGKMKGEEPPPPPL